MAAVEKRRPAVAPVAGFTDGGRPAVSRTAATAESEEDFLRQIGVTEMLRAALLKVLEARPEEPIAFLAHYFENMGLRSPANGGAGEPPGQLLLQQQRLGRALWHLRLAHHSQRCGPGRAGAGRGRGPRRTRPPRAAADVLGPVVLLAPGGPRPRALRLWGAFLQVPCPLQPASLLEIHGAQRGPRATELVLRAGSFQTRFP